MLGLCGQHNKIEYYNIKYVNLRLISSKLVTVTTIVHGPRKNKINPPIHGNYIYS